MKLSFDQIKDITFGALRIWEEDDGVHFSKCTEKQTEAWHKIDEMLGYRALCTTGVKLDFYTSSKSFSFSVSSGKKFEIYINNVLMHDLDMDTIESKSFTLSLDGNENRITLILPSHQIGVLSSVLLDDGAPITPHKHQRRFLFIGDSITQGWDSGYDSLSYAQRVSRFFNAEAVIHGIGGGCFEETTADDIDFDPEVVFIAFGTNDWGRSSLQSVLKHENKFMDSIAELYPDKKIVYISPIWRGDSDRERPAGSFEELCRAEAQVAREHGFFVIDGHGLVPHLGAFMSDGYLHPNAAGFGIYAENLISAIKDYIGL